LPLSLLLFYLSPNQYNAVLLHILLQTVVRIVVTCYPLCPLTDISVLLRQQYCQFTRYNKHFDRGHNRAFIFRCWCSLLATVTCLLSHYTMVFR